jgi:hypothetical protein
MLISAVEAATARSKEIGAQLAARQNVPINSSKKRQPKK